MCKFNERMEFRKCFFFQLKGVFGYIRGRGNRTFILCRDAFPTTPMMAFGSSLVWKCGNQVKKAAFCHCTKRIEQGTKISDASSPSLLR